MKRRILTSALAAFAYSLALSLTLIACGTQGGGASSSLPPSGGISASSSAPGSARPSGSPDSSVPPQALPADTSPQAPSPSGDPDKSAAPQEQGAAMARAYRRALERIYNDRVYPNGDPVDTFEMENNDFVIFDVDGDGQAELIYQNDDATMAGMMTGIYGFDSDTGDLYLELSGFVGMTFYDNGIISVAASHNHGMAWGLEDFWPFTLYQYDAGGGSYVMMGSVDAWNKAGFSQDQQGQSFPDDVDQDGDGVIFLLTPGGQEVSVTMLDGPDYQQWLSAFIDDAAPLELPWQTMTLKNIQAVAP